jgi:tRNA 2-thiouridine synthesizing protein E
MNQEDTMASREIGGKTVEFDEEGFMVDPDDWTREIAQVLAQEEGIDPLSDRHWQVIEFSRSDYQERGEAPTLRRITKIGGVPTKELYQLFPNGPAKKVARISGLSKPTGCV